MKVGFPGFLLCIPDRKANKESCISTGKIYSVFISASHSESLAAPYFAKSSPFSKGTPSESPKKAYDMVIAHNMAAMNAQRQVNIVTDKKQKSTEKLSSGYR
ncbi:hypothetical protein, partial [Dialister sp.]|uniref:hypothetical protein n=1 Tax=Dialister sp. TaxID=1955814 RepID=UPI002E8185E6